MTLSDYVTLFRRGWLIIAIFSMSSALFGALAALASPPSYTTAATLIATSAATGGDNGGASADVLNGRVYTYAQLVQSDAVLQRSAARLGVSPATLRGEVSASVRPETSLLDVSATSSSPQKAAAVAEAVAEELSSQAQLLDAEQPSGPVSLSVVSRAEIPDTPTTPGMVSFVLVGAVIGLALALALVVVRHALDDRIRSAGDLPRGIRFASVTSLPASPRWTRKTGGPNLRLEAFRRLRSTLDFVAAEGGVVTITSMSSKLDSRALVSDLARVIGEAGYEVVTVDMDLRAPIPQESSERPQTGIGHVILGKAEVLHTAVATNEPGVFAISNAGGDPVVAQRLGTPTLTVALKELANRFSFVLLAAPPIRERAESTILAAMSSATFLVAEAGESKKSQLIQSAELLAGLGVTEIGLVLDGVSRAEVGQASSSTSIN